MQVLHGDCLKLVPTLKPNSVDAICCDPPYHLHSIVKRFAKTGRTDKTRSKSGPHQRTARGFMNKKWDGGDIAFRKATWRKMYRVLKPGGYIIAFSSSRTFGRMSVALEDAGFITHPFIAWIFGSGFPKAHRINFSGLSDLDRETGGWEGWRYGTQSMKPAIEPIYVGQKPFEDGMTGAENIAKWGVGALNIDGCRVEHVTVEGGSLALNTHLRASVRRAKGDSIFNTSGAEQTFKPAEQGRWPANAIHDGSDEVIAAFPEAPSQMADASRNGEQCKTQNVYGAMKRGNGRDGEASAERRYGESGATNFAALPGARRGDEGSAARFFKSAQLSAEDIAWMTEPASYAVACSSLQSEAAVSVLSNVVARSMPGSALIKPSFRAPSTSATAPEFETLCETVIATILSFAPKCLRGSPPQSTTVSVSRAKGAATLELTGTMTITATHWKSDGSAEPVTFSITLPSAEHGERDSPDARRFHYSSKADAEDRFGSRHPTVKPIDLMAYLCRLVTPPGGTVLDPFAGSGTTGAACLREGFNCILIEAEDEYIPDIQARIELASAEGRHPSVIKHRNVSPEKASGADLPLFSTAAE